MYKYKFKIFFGTQPECPANKKINDWIIDHPNITIFDYQYQQARFGDHSICIRYVEDSDLFYDPLIKSGEVLNCQGE